MHENKFEKEVREKMEQFGFDPSEAVWVGVEKEINKEKKDRRPLFWLFFFFGLALLGGGIYFAEYKYATRRHQVSRGEPKMKNNPEKQSADESNQIKDSVQLNNAVIVRRIESGNSVTDQPEQKEGNIAKNNRKAEFAFLPEKYKDGLEKSRNIKRAGGQQTGANGFGDSSISRLENNRKIEAGHELAIAGVTKASVFPTDSVSGRKTIGKENKQSKKPSWLIGFSGSAGLSDVNQSLFKPTATTTYAYAPMATTVGTSAASPGFSFAAGAFAEKYLSNRISFRAGIGYHYYSTKISTGKAVNGPVYTFSANTQGLIANSFYSSGDERKYTNQYHFIELPVTVNFKLNRSIHNPLIWQAGLSFSYLVNSNALFFDPASNIYFENSQQFNRTQLNAVTGLLIGFDIHHGELQIGPLLHYGLTGLSKNSAGNPEHLLYYGVGICFIPGKK